MRPTRGGAQCQVMSSSASRSKSTASRSRGLSGRPRRTGIGSGDSSEASSSPRTAPVDPCSGCTIASSATPRAPSVSPRHGGQPRARSRTTPARSARWRLSRRGSRRPAPRRVARPERSRPWPRRCRTRPRSATRKYSRRRASCSRSARSRKRPSTAPPSRRSISRSKWASISGARPCSWRRPWRIRSGACRRWPNPARRSPRPSATS